MKPTEHIAKPASTPKAGLVATLCAFLGVKGSGAPKTSLGLILSVFAATLGGLAFTTTTALAAISPTVTIKPVGTVTPTTAKVSGTVNPNGGPMTVWDFEYAKDSETEGWTVSTLAGPALASEEVKGTLEGLEPNTAYEVRLVATNEEGGEGVSAEPNPTFKTAVSKPTVVSLSAPLPKIEEARLEATVNPSNETTECHFQYGEVSVSEHTVECEQGNALEGGEQPVGANATSLKPDTTYHYRVLLKNGTGETTEASTFKTAIHPETPTGLKVEAITASTATLTGTLNPKAAGNPGSYEFLYKASAKECEGGEPAGGSALGNKEEAVEAKPTLAPNTTYTVCLRAHNEAGEESTLTAPITFTTLVAAPAIEIEASTVIDATEARLEATINPGNSETSYHFEYGTSAGSYDVSVPGVSGHIPAGLTAKSVNAAATDLEPGTTYHYRVVASNALPGVVEYGSDQTFTTPAAAPSPGTPGSCANEKLREEQPYGLGLPDCRAYEMVSPPDTNGNDATVVGTESPRASEAKEAEPAITYTAKGSFGKPGGSLTQNQYVSRRTPSGWGTQAVTPLSSAGSKGSTEDQEGTYPGTYFTPELTEGLADTSARLGEAPPLGDGFGVYVAQFGGGDYRYVGPVSSASSNAPWGASTQLGRVVLTNEENQSLLEWVDGTEVPVSVTNTSEEEELPASAGSVEPNYQHGNEKDAWHATSEDGSRVFFTTPSEAPETKNRHGGIGQLYVRVNVGVGQPQSPLADGEANGTGALTAGSETVTSLVAATGEASGEEPAAGATELKSVTTKSGRFAVGAEISGPSIAPGTTITAVSGVTLTLSTPTTAKMPGNVPIESSGPEPFTVGQKLTANGIPLGTTITAVAPGSLTLSAPAAASGTAVALTGGGQCTVAEDACTIEVSASQRFLHSNPAGTQAARYWGASADGSKGFFTSNAELTEDAYTGPAGNGANLYEYDLATGKLTDLTGESTDNTGDGAAVQGVVQISEEGQYVYFVAKGALAGNAKEQQCRPETQEEREETQPKQENLGCNLYVSHEGGKPMFIATLAGERDITDWQNGGPENAGPEVNTAVVNQAGSQLAFISERSLPTANFPAGYDNQQAQPGVRECESELENNEVESGRCREVYLYDAETGGLVCTSCNPSGARPVGPASLPGVTARTEAFADYRPRDLLADGALFFDSKDALAQHASGGIQNVYEYEHGEAHAISNVVGGYESFFLDASPTGQNVFFASADKLLPEDPGGNAVVWDAREDGGFPVVTLPPTCDNADSCKAPESPQPGVFAPPASSTFSGPGNPAPSPPAVLEPAVKPKTLTRAQKLADALKSCRKDQKKSRRATCEKSARKKYAPVKAKKKAKKSANTNRRESR